MSNNRAYPRYKDTGFFPLLSVPEHWSTRRLANLGTFMKAAGGPKEEDAETGIPCVRYGDLYMTYDVLIRDVNRFISAEIQDKYTSIQQGDILFAASGETIEEIGKSAVNLSTEPACCGGDLVVLRPFREIDPVFLAFAVSSVSAQVQKSAMAKGFTVVHIYGDQLRKLVVAIPPPDEQRLIARKIEEETLRTNALIAKKERFIQILKEKRQTLITRAVTKGLMSDTSLRKTGIEWLEEIPAHWEELRMATIFREAIRQGDPALPVLSISIHDGISDDEIAPEERERRVSRIEDRMKYKRVVPGDLAYNMMRAWQGAFGAVTVDGLVSPAYVVAEPIRNVRTAYIEHLLRTPMAVEEMRRYSRGIADFRMRLYWDYFRDLKVCVPPVEEQDQILDWIAQETERLDVVIGKTRRSIDLLKERRMALIDAAVTGQIDLREAA